MIVRHTWCMKCGVQLSVHLPGIFRSQFLGPWGLRPEYSGRSVTRVNILVTNITTVWQHLIIRHLELQCHLLSVLVTNIFLGMRVTVCPHYPVMPSAIILSVVGWTLNSTHSSLEISMKSVLVDKTQDQILKLFKWELVFFWSKNSSSIIFPIYFQPRIYHPHWPPSTVHA